MKNEKTGLEMLEAKGTINLSDSLSDYGPEATEEDIQTYRRFIADHAPNADVTVGAYYEAGWNPEDDDDEAQDGDEWMNRMWDAFPEFRGHVLNTRGRETAPFPEGRGTMEGEIKLTAKQIDMMKHAIGYDGRSVKRGKYVAYRNYYASPDPMYGWEEMFAAGLAEKSYEDKSRYFLYRLSPAGMSTLADILGIRIEEGK